MLLSSQTAATKKMKTKIRTSYNGSVVFMHKLYKQKHNEKSRLSAGMFHTFHIRKYYKQKAYELH
jgi:hypothetical protein